MDELFRFVALRKPETAASAIVLGGETPLAKRLAHARRLPDARRQMELLARWFAESDRFVSPDTDDLALPWAQLADAFAGAKVLDPARAAAIVRRVMDAGPEAVVEWREFGSDLARLEDSVLALKLAAPDDAEPGYVLRLLAAADGVRRVAAGQVLLPVSEELLVILPASVLPLPVERPPDQAPTLLPPAPPDDAALSDRAAALTEAVHALQAAASNDAAGASAVVDAIAAPADGGARMMLSQHAVSTLAPAVRQTLRGLDIDPAVVALPNMVRDLSTRLASAVSGMAGEVTIGGSIGAIIGPIKPVTLPPPHDDASDPNPVVLQAPPATYGKAKPAGWADLLVVRQHVLGYSPGEVAYVESVARGEKLTRTTARTDTDETLTTTINETTDEQQRDVQATDRFDLQRESTDVLRSDSSRQPGSTEAPSYGVMLESTSESKSHTQREAGTFGRDVTTRAVGRVTERVRTETAHRTGHSFTERVRHTFDNSAEDTNEIFVYRWLDRIVEAQVFTYGKRLFYDLVVPEPAALLLRALAHRHAPEDALVKPAPFALKPSELTEYNYEHYVRGYQATSVPPPPEATIVVSHTFAKVAKPFSDRPADRQLFETDATTLAIPAGYSAARASVQSFGWATGEAGDNHQIWVIVGKHRLNLELNGGSREIALDGEVGPAALPFTLGIHGYEIDTVNVEVACEPTDRSIDEWRQRTYDTILLAARQRIAEYEDRAASLRAAVRIEALTLSADKKRSMERDELERSCLAILTDQQFDGLSAVGHSPEGYPQPFLPNVEPIGLYVRFLQQAFEWEQMTWRYHPYFWGRKPYWLDKILLDDDDDEFRGFLRAGSARVLLSVRPGYEGALAHFMETGTVPTLGELGQIGGRDYVPFLSERGGVDVAIDRAVPYGDPWQVLMPTSLVALGPGQSTPTWKASVSAEGIHGWAPGPPDEL
jgi:hypothetical protein